MARRGFGHKKSKGKFDDLPSDFKDAVAQSAPEQINGRICQITKDTEELLAAQEKDQDYQEKKKALKLAGAIYRDGKKTNRLKIQYCIQVLGDKGKV